MNFLSLYYIILLGVVFHLIFFVKMEKYEKILWGMGLLLIPVIVAPTYWYYKLYSNLRN